MADLLEVGLGTSVELAHPFDGALDAAHRIVEEAGVGVIGLTEYDVDGGGQARDFSYTAKPLLDYRNLRFSRYRRLLARIFVPCPSPGHALTRSAYSQLNGPPDGSTCAALRNIIHRLLSPVEFAARCHAPNRFGT